MIYLIYQIHNYLFLNSFFACILVITLFILYKLIYKYKSIQIITLIIISIIMLIYFIIPKNIINNYNMLKLYLLLFFFIIIIFSIRYFLIKYNYINITTLKNIARYKLLLYFSSIIILYFINYENYLIISYTLSFTLLLLIICTIIFDKNNIIVRFNNDLTLSFFEFDQWLFSRDLFINIFSKIKSFYFFLFLDLSLLFLLLIFLPLKFGIPLFIFFYFWNKNELLAEYHSYILLSIFLNTKLNNYKDLETSINKFKTIIYLYVPIDEIPGTSGNSNNPTSRMILSASANRLVVVGRLGDGTEIDFNFERPSCSIIAQEMIDRANSYADTSDELIAVCKVEIAESEAELNRLFTKKMELEQALYLNSSSNSTNDSDSVRMAFIIKEQLNDVDDSISKMKNVYNKCHQMYLGLLRGKRVIIESTINTFIKALPQKEAQLGIIRVSRGPLVLGVLLLLVVVLLITYIKEILMI